MPDISLHPFNESCESNLILTCIKIDTLGLLWRPRNRDFFNILRGIPVALVFMHSVAFYHARMDRYIQDTREINMSHGLERADIFDFNGSLLLASFEEPYRGDMRAPSCQILNSVAGVL